MLKQLLLAASFAALIQTVAPAALRAETLTVSVNTAINTLDPHATRSVGSDLSFLGHIFDTLTDRADDGTVIPHVATRWEAEGEKLWRVWLRDDVTFPDGSRLDAEAVKWNIDRIINKDNALRARSSIDRITSVDVVSPTELLIHTSAPFPTFPTEATAVHLLSPAWVAEHKPVSEPWGSGAYELASFRSGDVATLKLRENYWGKKPAFDEVIFRTIPDPAAELAAFQAGEVDVITGFSPTEIERINAIGNATAEARPSVRPAFVKFNLEQGPLSKSAELRRALNYAIDKQAITEAFFAGHTEPLKGQVLSPVYLGYNPDLDPYPYDPQKARELIAASGFSPAELTFEFLVPTDAYLHAVDISQFITAQLAEVGVTANITQIDFAGYMNRYVTEHTMPPLLYLSQASGTLDASAIYRLYASTNRAYSYVSDEKLDTLQAAGASELDTEKRKEIYKELSVYFREFAPVLFLFDQPRTVAYSKRVKWNPRSDEIVSAHHFELAGN